jgi:hypothetical protein
MQHVGRFQLRRLIRQALFIHQQGKIYAGFLPKELRVTKVSQADRRQRCPCIPDLSFVFTQLRDVLSAEDSTVMPQENQHRSPMLPKRAELHITARRIGQNKRRKPLSQCSGHNSAYFTCKATAGSPPRP